MAQKPINELLDEIEAFIREALEIIGEMRLVEERIERRVELKNTLRLRPGCVWWIKGR